ncbi:MAG: family transporter [Solirubrobacterales bacterium]|nr:family transporter [Solirubrobacterales bacterium]
MTRRTLALFLAASLAWGIPYLFAKIALEDLSAVVTVWARAVLGAAVLLPLAARRGLLAPLRGRLVRLGWLAVFDLAAPTLLVTLGVGLLPSSLAGTLMAAVPIMVALLALRFDATERASGLRLVGLLVGIGGVAVLLGVEVSGDARALLGGVLVLAAASTYAGGTLYYKRHFSEEPALGVLAGALVACVVMTTIPAALSLPDAAPPAQAWLALAVLGIGCTAGGYLAFYALIARIGSGRASVITYVAPAIAVTGGVVVLDEPLTAGVVAGLLLVLVGSWLATGGRPPGAWRARVGCAGCPAAAKQRPKTPPPPPRLTPASTA